MCSGVLRPGAHAHAVTNATGHPQAERRIRGGKTWCAVNSLRPHCWVTRAHPARHLQRRSAAAHRPPLRGATRELLSRAAAAAAARPLQRRGGASSQSAAARPRRRAVKPRSNPEQRSQHPAAPPGRCWAYADRSTPGDRPWGVSWHSTPGAVPRRGPPIGITARAPGAACQGIAHTSPHSTVCARARLQRPAARAPATCRTCTGADRALGPETPGLGPWRLEERLVRLSAAVTPPFAQLPRAHQRTNEVLGLQRLHCRRSLPTTTLRQNENPVRAPGHTLAAGLRPRRTGLLAPAPPLIVF